MIEIEVETTVEIWRTEDTTFTVMYPFPNVAYIKGLRGKFTKDLRESMKVLLKERGITLVHYERRRPDGRHQIREIKDDR